MAWVWQQRHGYDTPGHSFVVCFCFWFPFSTFIFIFAHFVCIFAHQVRPSTHQLSSRFFYIQLHTYTLCTTTTITTSAPTAPSTHTDTCTIQHITYRTHSFTSLPPHPLTIHSTQPCSRFTQLHLTSPPTHFRLTHKLHLSLHFLYNFLYNCRYNVLWNVLCVAKKTRFSTRLTLAS